MGPGKRHEVARLGSLRTPESSLWLRTLPTETALSLTDVKWQWAARLRLGMPLPVIDSDCGGCKSIDAHATNSWHPLACVPLSGRSMTVRHNDVVNLFGRFCRLMQLAVQSEPRGLFHEDHKRPDLQVSLPDCTILSDVTITHPGTKTGSAVVAKHGADAIGDLRDAGKNSKYGALAAEIDMEFSSIVLYTIWWISSKCPVLHTEAGPLCGYSCLPHLSSGF